MADESDPAAAEEPGWSVLFDLWLLRQALHPLIEHSIRDTGWSADEYGMYLMIDDFGPLTPSRLQSLTGLPQHAVAAALKRIESRGHLERVPNAKDRRSVLVALNSEGVAQKDAAIAANLGLLERVLSRIDSHRCRQSVVELSEAVREMADMPAHPSMG